MLSAVVGSFCSQLGAAYISATTGAVVTALGLKSLAKVRPLTHTYTHAHTPPALWRG